MCTSLSTLIFFLYLNHLRLLLWGHSTKLTFWHNLYVLCFVQARKRTRYWLRVFSSTQLTCWKFKLLVLMLRSRSSRAHSIEILISADDDNFKLLSMSCRYHRASLNRNHLKGTLGINRKRTFTIHLGLKIDEGTQRDWGMHVCNLMLIICNTDCNKFSNDKRISLSCVCFFDVFLRKQGPSTLEHNMYCIHFHSWNISSKHI